MSGVKIEGEDFSNRGTTSTTGSATGAASSVATPLSMFQALTSGALASPSRLSAEGQTYSDKILELLKKDLPGFEKQKFSTTSYEAHIFRNGNMAIALIFKETYQSVSEKPVAFAIRDLRTKWTGPRIDHSIVIGREDYARVEQAAAHIRNSYVSTQERAYADMTLDQLAGANAEYQISMDRAKIQQYIDQRSPHSVPARDDVGFLLYMRTLKPGVQNNPFIQQNNEERYDYSPIMAVTGYTQFYMLTQPTGFAPMMQNGIGNCMVSSSVKFLPMICVTDVVSDLKNTSITASAIVLAIDALIQKGGWLNQFNTYGQNEPNIGTLINDPQTNKPWRAKDQATRDQFIQQYVLPPIIAFDITEGRARIPAIWQIVDDAPTFVTNISRFLKVDSLGSGDPCLNRYLEFDGQCTLPGSTQIVDTRCIDYLRLASEVSNTTEIMSFLSQSNDPAQNIRNIKRFIPATESLYMTMRSVLNPDFAKTVTTLLAGSNAMKLAYDYTNNNNTYNMTGLANLSQLYTQFSGISPIGAGNAASWSGNNLW